MSIMPALRVVNRWWGDPAMFPILRDAFADGQADVGEGFRRLIDVALEHGDLDDEGHRRALDAIDGVSSVLGSFPKSHQAALDAVLRDAVDRGVPVQVAWQPAYDHELSITEFQDTADEVCGITVVLRSRHASDPRLTRSGP